MLGLALSRNAFVVYAIIAFAGWMHFHDQQVASVAVAKVEKATDNAAKKGRRAAERSTTVGVRGVIDPTTRDD